MISRFRAVGVGTALVTLFACGGDAAKSVAPVEPELSSGVASISLTPTTMFVAVGGTATLVAVAKDSLGAIIPAPRLAYTSADKSVAAISTAGVVAGVKAGTAKLTAATPSATAATFVTVVASPALTGRAVAVGGTPSGLQVVLRMGDGTNAQSFTGPVNSDGSFNLRAPIVPTFGAFDLILDAPASSRVYHPVDASVVSGTATQIATRPLLIPRLVSFSSPTFGDTSVTVSLVDAFARICADDTNVNCSSFFPQTWKTIVATWPDSVLPIPVAFDRGASTAAIVDADSIATWKTIRLMEADLGRHLFDPAMLSGLTPPVSGFSRNAVLISVDSTLIGQGYSGYSTWARESSSLIGAVVRVASTARLASRSVVTHELGHALGFQHTCAWVSVMAGGYTCNGAPSVTKADAAAFTLGYAIRQTVAQYQTTTTLGDALRGELAFEPRPVASRIGTSPIVPFAPVTHRLMVIDGKTVVVEGSP